MRFVFGGIHIWRDSFSDGIHFWRDLIKTGFALGGIQFRRDSPSTGFVLGGIQFWRDSGKTGFISDGIITTGFILTGYLTTGFFLTVHLFYNGLHRFYEAVFEIWKSGKVAKSAKKSLNSRSYHFISEAFDQLEFHKSNKKWMQKLIVS